MLAELLSIVSIRSLRLALEGLIPTKTCHTHNLCEYTLKPCKWLFNYRYQYTEQLVSHMHD